MHTMKKTIVAALAALTMGSGVAVADDCPHTYKPVHRKPKAAKPVVTPVAPPSAPECNCVGQKGDQGPPGPKGPPGVPGTRGDSGQTTYVTRVEYRSTVGLRLGVMGAAYLKRGDWEWGPALELYSQVSKKDEFVIDFGYGGPLNGSYSPGRESGFLFHAGLAHQVDDTPLSLTVGVHYTDIEGSQANGYISGQYLAGDIGIVVRKSWRPVNLRVEFTPTLGGLRDTRSVSDTQLAVGLAGSVFLGGNW